MGRFGRGETHALGRRRRIFRLLQFRDGNLQCRPGREDDGSLDEVFQFSDIAGSGISGQGLHGLRWDALERLLHPPGIF